ncbi:putative sporulation protein YtxC [Lederbergia sp. NSJ-179]|uniref:putative sporulation protein YtxC n=1 Tax=Lederbergia sp. NSJ-179 TaxID=2931402 RepID=UPI001FD383BE|nr:putative sporulation protein YtxC [Lederbergia sp. NSJ-179]MCJ7839762.1 putative sporulation protein YtxC [Lederbergia sp. NSJ-179]
MFKSIKEAIRLKSFLATNGLQDSFQEKRGRYIYSFQPIFSNKDQYVSALIQYIQKVKRNEWVDYVLQKNYKYENEDERHDIIEIVTQMFNGERKELTALTGVIEEEILIKEAVVDLLDFKGAVAFDSFLKFRLREYFKHVTTYLGVAIDEYKMEQDYQVFVQTLRDYLQGRHTKQSIVHLILERPVTFYDDALEEMTQEKINALLDPRLLSNHPVYVDSAVIAPLLSMAPNKIFLYTEDEDQPLIRTLKNIFEERMTIFSSSYFYQLSKTSDQHS